MPEDFLNDGRFGGLAPRDLLRQRLRDFQNGTVQGPPVITPEDFERLNDPTFSDINPQVAISSLNDFRTGATQLTQFSPNELRRLDYFVNNGGDLNLGVPANLLDPPPAPPAPVQPRQPTAGDRIRGSILESFGLGDEYGVGFRQPYLVDQITRDSSGLRQGFDELSDPLVSTIRGGVESSNGRGGFSENPDSFFSAINQTIGNNSATGDLRTSDQVADLEAERARILGNAQLLDSLGRFRRIERADIEEYEALKAFLSINDGDETEVTAEARARITEIEEALEFERTLLEDAAQFDVDQRNSELATDRESASIDNQRARRDLAEAVASGQRDIDAAAPQIDVRARAAELAGDATTDIRERYLDAQALAQQQEQFYADALSQLDDQPTFGNEALQRGSQLGLPQRSTGLRSTRDRLRSDARQRQQLRNQNLDDAITTNEIGAELGSRALDLGSRSSQARAEFQIAQGAQEAIAQQRENITKAQEAAETKITSALNDLRDTEETSADTVREAEADAQRDNEKTQFEADQDFAKKQREAQEAAAEARESAPDGDIEDAERLYERWSILATDGVNATGPITARLATDVASGRLEYAEAIAAIDDLAIEALTADQKGEILEDMGLEAGSALPADRIDEFRETAFALFEGEINDNGDRIEDGLKDVLNVGDFGFPRATGGRFDLTLLDDDALEAIFELSK